jgi:hypothetical protein
MSKLLPLAPPAVLSLSKDGPQMPTVVRQARHGVGARGPLASALRCLMASIPLALLLVLLPCDGAVRANWLSKVVGAAEHAAPRAAKLGSGALESAALHLRSLPAKAEGSAALAAQATQEGHWRFVNRAGETFTAGTPEELKRVAAVLLPEAKADAKLSLYVTEDTVFQHRASCRRPQRELSHPEARRRRGRAAVR